MVDAAQFGYIGKRHLELALADSTHAADAQIAWKSFQLNPAAPRFPQMTNAERLAKKYGRDLAGRTKCIATSPRARPVSDPFRSRPRGPHQFVRRAPADSSRRRIGPAGQHRRAGCLPRISPRGGTSAITSSFRPSATGSAWTVTRSANCSPAIVSLKTCRNRPKRAHSASAVCLSSCSIVITRFRGLKRMNCTPRGAATGIHPNPRLIRRRRGWGWGLGAGGWGLGAGGWGLVLGLKGAGTCGLETCSQGARARRPPIGAACSRRTGRSRRRVRPGSWPSS